MHNWETASEVDVREELLAPLLAKLGYERGSSNDLIREMPLRYDSISLGRRKGKDPKLLGFADYVLKVVGENRWVLEAKPPHEAIGEENIAQALSYARHPEVSAVYAAICNGRRFVVFAMSQSQDDPPLLDVDVESVDHLYRSVAATLAPESVRRAFKLPRISTDRALSTGLRSHEEFEGGFFRYSDAAWETKIPLQRSEIQKIEETVRRLKGYESAVTGGGVFRKEDGRIVANFNWSAPHASILDLAERKGLTKISHVCLDDEISSDPNNPSIFDFTADIGYEEGEEIFDIVEWSPTITELPADVRMTGQAMGLMQGQIFMGFFGTQLIMTIPTWPNMPLIYNLAGTFEVYFRE